MYKSGQRVTVSRDYRWAKSALATIKDYPSAAAELFENAQGCHRWVMGVKGPVLFYYVEFDVPQIDSDGDGPYKGGEIPYDFLVPLEAGSGPTA
jgi:hypothetical protein